MIILISTVPGFFLCAGRNTDAILAEIPVVAMISNTVRYCERAPSASAAACSNSTVLDVCNSLIRIVTTSTSIKKHQFSFRTIFQYLLNFLLGQDAFA